MDSCQWKEEGGASGWISVFALARHQETPLFFSAGDNKWRGQRPRSLLARRRGEEKEENIKTAMYCVINTENGNKKRWAIKSEKEICIYIYKY